LLAGTKREFLLAQGAITEKDLTPEDLKNSEKTRLFNAMIDFGEIEIINTKLDFRRFLEL
jgi:4-amino-4-deoxychorismate lyase